MKMPEVLFHHINRNFREVGERYGSFLVSAGSVRAQNAGCNEHEALSLHYYHLHSLADLDKDIPQSGRIAKIIEITEDGVVGYKVIVREKHKI